MVKDLALPEALLDHESVVKMLTLLFPCTTRRRLPLLPVMENPVDRIPFAQVFRENNLSLRQKFFSDPLVKYLWSKIFIVECPDICIDHLRRIRSHSEQGEEKFSKFCKEIARTEMKFNFKMLPDSAKKSENITVFSKSE